MSEHAYTARALPRRPDVRRSERPGAISALGVAALCVAGLVLVWTLASQVPVVRVKDAVALYDFTLLSGPRIDRPLNCCCTCSNRHSSCCGESRSWPSRSRANARASPWRSSR